MTSKQATPPAEVMSTNLQTDGGPVRPRASSSNCASDETAAWFQESWSAWQTTLQDWKQRQRRYKASSVTDVAGTDSAQLISSRFKFEDWALLNNCFELHLLMHSVKSELPQALLPFYYNKYFGKQFVISIYGFKEFRELAAILSDTVEIKGERACLEPRLSQDTSFDRFVVLTDTQRIIRSSRLDRGDLSGILRFARHLS